MSDFEKMFEKENLVPHEMIRFLAEYLCNFVDDESNLLLEFYSIRYKRGFDFFVFGFFPPEEIWCSQETDVKAFLFEWDWDQNKLVDSTEKEKEIFSMEYDSYHYGWLPFEVISDV